MEYQLRLSEISVSHDVETMTGKPLCVLRYYVQYVEEQRALILYPEIEDCYSVFLSIYQT